VPRCQLPKFQSTAYFGALDDALVQKILEVLKQKPEISQGEMAEELGTTRRVIQKKMILLKEAGRIERIGGNRYGHWIIHE
jgi:ATP-dependent DNA helicase RecG